MPMRSIYRKFLCGPSSSNERAPVTGPSASQQEVALLARLPLEIRLKIWREVVGDSLLHLTLVQSIIRTATLRCFPCRAFHTDTNAPTPTGQTPYPRCQGSQKEPCFFSGPAEHFGALSLLLSSRQIYTEAVDLLYSTNIINIDSLEPLQMFIKWVGQRVTSIRTVHVNIAMWRIRCREVSRIDECAFAEWAQFWQLLGEWFTGLQFVRLDIYGTSHAGLNQADLQPLLGLEDLKTFDLSVWRDTNGGDLAGQDTALSRPLEAFVRASVCERG
ncbi:MAG: hypothetical protein Q9219_004667 [cf. Caloplaca sp. 3 TL-2023]